MGHQLGGPPFSVKNRDKLLYINGLGFLVAIPPQATKISQKAILRGGFFVFFIDRRDPVRFGLFRCPPTLRPFATEHAVP